MIVGNKVAAGRMPALKKWIPLIELNGTLMPIGKNGDFVLCNSKKAALQRAEEERTALKNKQQQGGKALAI